MNHIDFVLWVVGWAWIMALQPIKGTWFDFFRHVALLIVWILVAILLWKGAV